MPSKSKPFRPGEPIAPELASGAVLLNESGDRALLLHLRSEDRWCFPKGHVDPGESLERAARREIEEETGFARVRLGPEVAEVNYRFFSPSKGRNVHKTSIYFIAYTRERAASPEPIFDRAEWMPLKEARKRLKFSTDRTVLDAARSKVSR